MPVFDHFSWIAPYYNQAIDPRRQALLLKYARLPAEGTLLDAGGGTGRIARGLAGQVDRVVLADVSVGMLTQARLHPELFPVRGAVERLPFADGAFSRIIMIDALHHVASQQQTALELWRVLQPGGRLLIEEPNIEKLAVKVVAVGEKVLLMRSRFLRPVAIARLFSSPAAHVSVVREGFICWIAVDKPVQDMAER